MVSYTLLFNSLYLNNWYVLYIYDGEINQVYDGMYIRNHLKHGKTKSIHQLLLIVTLIWMWLTRYGILNCCIQLFQRVYYSDY